MGEDSVDRFNLRSLTFGLMTGAYSVAMTYILIGFPLETFENIFRVVCLFIVGCVGGVFAYKRDPKKAWSLITFILPTAKK